MAVFRIRDVLVRIRDRISNHWITDPDLEPDANKKSVYLLITYCSVGSFTLVFKDIKSFLRSNINGEIKCFPNYFLLADGTIRIQSRLQIRKTNYVYGYWRPKTCGSYGSISGSRSGTLVNRQARDVTIRIHTRTFAYIITLVKFLRKIMIRCLN
jgi:hypothetical protein